MSTQVGIDRLREFALSSWLSGCELLSAGLLDTSTVIRLGRIADVSALPDEPVISAISLAELTVGPLITDDDDERAVVRPTCSLPSPTSMRCRSTLPPRGLSAELRRTSGERGASLPPAPMTH